MRQQLDELAAEVEAGLPAGVRYPLRVIKEINRVLYQVRVLVVVCELMYSAPGAFAGCVRAAVRTSFQPHSTPRLRGG